MGHGGRAAAGPRAAPWHPNSRRPGDAIAIAGPKARRDSHPPTRPTEVGGGGTEGGRPAEEAVGEGGAGRWRRRRGGGAAAMTLRATWGRTGPTQTTKHPRRRGRAAPTVRSPLGTPETVCRSSPAPCPPRSDPRRSAKPRTRRRGRGAHDPSHVPSSLDSTASVGRGTRRRTGQCVIRGCVPVVTHSFRSVPAPCLGAQVL